MFFHSTFIEYTVLLILEQQLAMPKDIAADSATSMHICAAIATM